LENFVGESEMYIGSLAASYARDKVQGNERNIKFADAHRALSLATPVGESLEKRLGKNQEHRLSH
jgi:hypothetical protein